VDLLRDEGYLQLLPGSTERLSISVRRQRSSSGGDDEPAGSPCGNRFLGGLCATHEVRLQTENPEPADLPGYTQVQEAAAHPPAVHHRDHKSREASCLVLSCDGVFILNGDHRGGIVDKDRLKSGDNVAGEAMESLELGCYEADDGIKADPMLLPK